MEMKRLDESLSKETLFKSRTGRSPTMIDTSKIKMSASGNIQPVQGLDWIICSQEKEVIDRFNFDGGVVWVNRCLRCGGEEPVYEVPVDQAVSKSQEFIWIHKRCEAK